MPVDPYALCPCGSGKKLKFCCADVAGEIEKIHRMIEGEQPRAALRHTEQALASHPGRASLLDLKAILELSLDELEAAHQTIEQFVAAHPKSVAAHACHALLLSQSGKDPHEMVAALQRALSLVDGDVPQRLFEAIGAVGQALLLAGHVVAAQAHLWLNAAIAPSDESRALELIVGLNHHSGLPLLLRDRLHLRSWPEDAPWKAEAETASQRAGAGKWQEAVEIVDRLGQQHGAHPTLVYNRALLGGWLADERALIAGLHAYAQMEVPLDDAVEAEAIAQLLDPDLHEEHLDSVVQIYEVTDLDRLSERFDEDRRLHALEIDRAMLQSHETRPRQSYVLLDKPLPESGADLGRDDVPRVIGVLAVFGRQTDRPERLELMTEKGRRFEAIVAALKQIAGEALGGMLEEKVIGSTTPTEQALNWRWQFPRDTPPDVRRRLSAEERRAAIVERWPSLPRPSLAGKTPREAAADPRMRIPLLAAVLILEQGTTSAREQDAIAELRTELGLPQPEPIEAIDEVTLLPLVRLPRLKMEQVGDDDLVQLYRWAVLTGAGAALSHVAEEVARRPSVSKRIPPQEAYRRMITAENDPERALALIDEARQKSEAAGESIAEWDVAELELHLSSGEGELARAALERIAEKHMHDPEVASKVYRLLYEAGIMPPEGAPIEELPEDMIAGEAVAAEGEAAASRIWTPDADRPAGSQSRLWTPS